MVLKAATADTGVRLIGVPMDEAGIIPEALRPSSSGDIHRKAVYLIPTIHNPTTATMPLSRRRDGRRNPSR